VKAPEKLLGVDIETSEMAKDDAILGITVASTVTGDGEEKAWYSVDASGTPLQNMNKETALSLLYYLEEKQKADYAICAWNGAGFDLKMLGHLAGDLKLAGRIVMRMYDPMFQVLSQKGFAVGLAAAAKGLGVDQAKTMNGADAPEAWKKGEFEKVIKYVIGDSQMTVKIIQAIIKTEGIRWISKAGKKSFAPFMKLKTVSECLAEPPPDQSWMTNPLNRKDMVKWIPNTVVSNPPRQKSDDPDKGLKPVLILVAGPSGVGKNALCDELLKTLDMIVKPVTTTTRGIRSGEKDGVDYNFVSVDKFEKMISAGEFLEWAEVYGNKYGSPKAEISSKLAKGQDMIMIVDVQGVKSIRKFMDGIPKAMRDRFHLADVFIMPPSVDILKKRLLERGKDTPEIINKRITDAAGEIAQASTYKYVIVNDDMHKSWDRLRSIVIAERCRS